MKLKIVHLERGVISKPFPIQYIDGDLVEGIERPEKPYIYFPGYKPGDWWEEVV